MGDGRPPDHGWTAPRTTAAITTARDPDGTGHPPSGPAGAEAVVRRRPSGDPAVVDRRTSGRRTGRGGAPGIGLDDGTPACRSGPRVNRAPTDGPASTAAARASASPSRMPEGAAGGLQDAGPQPDRDGDDGTGAEQDSGRRQSLLFGRADDAVFDVTAHPLAQQWRQRPVPLAEDGGQIAAVPRPARATRATPSERRAVARARTRPCAALGAAIPSAPATSSVESPGGRPGRARADRGARATHGVVDHRRQVGIERAPGGRVGVRTGVDRDVLGREIRPSRSIRARQVWRATAKQPAAQPVRLAQPAEPGGGHDEDVLQAVVGVGLVADDRPAERQQVTGVTVEDRGQGVPVAVGDAADELGFGRSSRRSGSGVNRTAPGLASHRAMRCTVASAADVLGTGRPRAAPSDGPPRNVSGGSGTAEYRHERRPPVRHTVDWRPTAAARRCRRYPPRPGVFRSLGKPTASADTRLMGNHRVDVSGAVERSLISTAGVRNRPRPKVAQGRCGFDDRELVER